MLRIIPFLGLVVGMVACRAPERVAELGQRAETPGRSIKVGQRAERPGGILAPVFLREHGGEPSFEPKTRSALSAEEASVLAARLANDQCESRYQRRPFKPEQYPAVLREGVYHWGKLDVGGHEGFSASVTFYPDGSEPHVEVYFSSDTVLGMK
jgi:hypothetical protein